MRANKACHWCVVYVSLCMCMIHVRAGEKKAGMFDPRQYGEWQWREWCDGQAGASCGGTYGKWMDEAGATTLRVLSFGIAEIWYKGDSLSMKRLNLRLR